MEKRCWDRKRNRKDVEKKGIYKGIKGIYWDLLQDITLKYLKNYYIIQINQICYKNLCLKLILVEEIKSKYFK